MIKNAIQKLANKEDLTFTETEAVVNEIMSGQADNIQISALLTALTLKGETIDEIAGAAKAMRAHALAFTPREDVLEIVGTGGDHENSFNISTTTA